MNALFVVVPDSQVTVLPMFTLWSIPEALVRRPRLEGGGLFFKA